MVWCLYVREFYIEYGNYERGQEAIPIALFKSSFVCTIIGNRTIEIYVLNCSQLESFHLYYECKNYLRNCKRQFLSVIITINQVFLTLALMKYWKERAKFRQKQFILLNVIQYRY